MPTEEDKKYFIQGDVYVPGMSDKIHKAMAEARLRYQQEESATHIRGLAENDYIIGGYRKDPDQRLEAWTKVEDYDEETGTFTVNGSCVFASECDVMTETEEE